MKLPPRSTFPPFSHPHCSWHKNNKMMNKVYFRSGNKCMRNRGLCSLIYVTKSSEQKWVCVVHLPSTLSSWHYLFLSSSCFKLVLVLCKPNNQLWTFPLRTKHTSTHIFLLTQNVFWKHFQTKKHFHIILYIIYNLNLKEVLGNNK